MNNLPANLIPPNQRDLERIEQGNKFPAKAEEVDIDKEFNFFVYPFAKMRERQCMSNPNAKVQLLDLLLQEIHSMVAPMSLIYTTSQALPIYSPILKLLTRQYNCHI